MGVFSNHAYTILSVEPKFTHKGRDVILIKIRNPWGKKGWKGDWSFTSSLWTPELRKKFKFESDTQDGTFYINYDDFTLYFDSIIVSKVNLSYVNSSIENHSGRFDFYSNVFIVK